MNLYHFTAKRFLDGIKNDGLTRGHMVKTLNPPSFIPGMQWLTKNGEFSQSWAKGAGRLLYKRNEARITFCLPDDDRKLMPWLGKAEFLTPEVSRDLSAYGDPENWFVYDGSVPASWIIEIVEAK